MTIIKPRFVCFYFESLEFKKKDFYANAVAKNRIKERKRRKVFTGVLADEYAFNWRFRYNFAFALPMQGKVVLPKTTFLFFNNKVHINSGKEIVNNYFDQNRLFVG
jgi:hypothetical protein